MTDPRENARVDLSSMPEIKEAVRIKAQCVIEGATDWKTMAVDPKITSFEILHHLLKKAFEIRGDIELSYLLPKSPESITRPDVFLSLTSDWDLDAAFHTASMPHLTLKVEPVSRRDEWTLVDTSDTPPIQDIKSAYMQLPFGISLKHEVAKTLNKVKDALVDMSKKTPLKETEWASFFDSSGRLTDLMEFRIRTFCGGMDLCIRKEVWMHLLGVFPPDLSGEERKRFLMMRSQVYHLLKHNWQEKNPNEIEDVIHMVQKDVLRTDRTHEFFNVPEDHPNLVSLFNILTVYALNNPNTSYCQGMSDLAAPLLVVLEDETMAYWSFCALMQRMKDNFLPHGSLMKRNFQHLSLLLRRTDKTLHSHLQDIEAENFYFFYRMLLLDLKREFPFCDTLRVMEAIWSSIPPHLDDEESTVSFYYRLLQSFTSSGSGRSSPQPEGLYLNNSSDKDKVDPLPHPFFINNGCPFTLFLCLSILLNHREQILQQPDYNCVGMYFDKLARKHDANRVLARARSLFTEYIKAYLEGQTVGPEENKQSSPHGTASKEAQC